MGTVSHHGFTYLIGIEIAKIKPTEDVKQEIKETHTDHVKERYGAYIQSQGRYYN